MKLEPKQWNQVKEIIAAALELPAEQRNTFVRSQCGHQPLVSEEVLSLLSFNTADTSLQPRLIKDRYRIDAELGRGGFAVTYLASDQQLHDRRVVVKMLTNTQSDDYFRRKFEEEILALSRLVHPNIVIPLDSGLTSANQSYFVMQFVEGKTLRELIRGGTLARRTVIEIAKQLGNALAFAHSKGIVHRDVKPENILVQTAEDGSARVWLIDFGISSFVEQQAASMATHIVGTAAYMAPEQFRGEVSTKCDIYAFGAVIVEMLTGNPPFGKGDPFQIMERQTNRQLTPFVSQLHVDNRVSLLLEQALTFDPASRPTAIGPFALQVANAMEDQPAGQGRHFRTFASAGVVVAFLVIAAVLAAIKSPWHQQPGAPIPVKPVIQVQPETQPETEAVSGLGIVTLEISGHAETIVPDSSDLVEMKANDQFRINVKPLANIYLYVFAHSVESSDMHILFPSTTANAGRSFLALRQQETIPSKHWFSFQGEKGTEMLIMIFSKTPDPTLEEGRKYANARDQGAIPPGPLSDKIVKYLAGPNAARPTANGVEFAGPQSGCGWITIRHNT